MYEYSAQVLSVHDGDTAALEVDLGFDVRERMTIRFAGINAPELNTPAGKVARDVLIERLKDTSTATGLKRVTLHSIKDRREKYGRYLGRLVDDLGDVNQWMIDSGHALPFMVDRL